LISATDLETAVENAEILILATPHTAFREIDLKRISKRMQPEATVVDTRGFWTPAECKSVGLRYIGLGRP
jgi:UDP-N-acetyl-D-mannosaminuronate dehydrogenase